MSFKECSRCHELKHDRCFYKDRRSKRGLYSACKECCSLKMKQYLKDNPDKVRGWAKNQRRKNRSIVINHYGGKCSCCGEETFEFLSIDHCDGGGNLHRKDIGISIYIWLIKHNFPNNFRVLCYNCNLSIGFNGYCPHENSPEPAACGIIGADEIRI